MLATARPIILFILLFIDTTSNAFVIGNNQPKALVTNMKPQRSAQALHTSSMSTSESSSSEQKEPLEELTQKEMEELRKSLVLKYLELGKTPEVAEAEVDEFLRDKERCEQFLEMRRYAQAQADDLTDFNSVGQLALAFIVGLIGTIGPKLYETYQQSN